MKEIKNKLSVTIPEPIDEIFIEHELNQMNDLSEVFKVYHLKEGYVTDERQKKEKERIMDRYRKKTKESNEYVFYYNDDKHEDIVLQLSHVVSRIIKYGDVKTVNIELNGTLYILDTNDTLLKLI